MPYVSSNDILSSWLSNVTASEYMMMAINFRGRLLDLCKELGLWALDAPEEVGGAALRAGLMLEIHRRLARTVVPFRFPPDSPNLHMLMLVGNDDQKKRYMEPYAQGELRSNIAISEPQAGADPASGGRKPLRASARSPFPVP